MAAEGAAVALAARRKDRLDALVERIGDAGGRAVAVEADVADQAQARSLVADATDALGGLDCLVNNAGVMLLGLVEGAETDQWRRMVEVNLLGRLYCTHAGVPVMRDGGGGDIVNVASVAGRTARMVLTAYNMTKWAWSGSRRPCDRRVSTSASASAASSRATSTPSSSDTTATR
jgi:clavulanate-9-aldehyde reducatase